MLRDEQIAIIVKDFHLAARAASDLGFDFVDIKHCHGYLGHEFLSAHTRRESTAVVSRIARASCERSWKVSIRSHLDYRLPCVSLRLIPYPSGRIQDILTRNEGSWEFPSRMSN